MSELVFGYRPGYVRLMKGKHAQKPKFTTMRYN